MTETVMSEPCFADRLNLLFELIQTPRDPVTGRQRPYTSTELADAVFQQTGKPTPRRQRIEQLRADRAASPAVATANAIADGWAVLAYRGARPGDESEFRRYRLAFRHYLMVDDGEDGELAADQRARIERIHQQFLYLLDERDERARETAPSIAVRGRAGPDLTTADGRAEAMKNLTAAFRLDNALRQHGRPGSGLWARLLGRHRSPSESHGDLHRDSHRDEDEL